MAKRRKKNRGNPTRNRDKNLSEKFAKPEPESQGSPRILVYALLGIALFMGLYLHAYAMPQLSHFADGLSMPGARITGYDDADILALQSAFEDEAAGQLNFLHKTAGIVFPVMFFLAVWATMGLLARGTWRWAVVATAGGFASLDITENILIDAVLGQNPPETSMTAMASIFTQVSWALLAVISVVVVVVVVRDYIISGRAQRPDRTVN
ncbi:hypothetical protein HGQ17_08170 [Nesterenkonia sp. MY13]|uniref:Uncharacterized protein n=1 Tax=Nesterenkonia sedimenti TaxID=1463632 RepID=A0A7X8TJL7_9MICC|nr:hypothetical protein [Nesterenkonia sedimenti]NLS09972.1 hypothetical protein [Nesterenkonia sedimenti]